MRVASYLIYIATCLLFLNRPAIAQTETGGEAAEVPVQKLQKKASRETATTSQIYLLVNNPEEKRNAIKEKLSGLGGILVLTADNQIRFKIPPEKLSEALSIVAGEGEVVEKTLEREDLTLSTAELIGKLKSKLDILDKLKAFFNDADVTSAIDIETEMNGLIQEIEALKGKIRVAQERARWAVLDVSFQFRERQRIVYRQSPFDWINTVSLQSFLRDF